MFRCTLNAIPQTSALLNKARLPLGILIHPFKDLSVRLCGPWQVLGWVWIWRLALALCCMFWSLCGGDWLAGCVVVSARKACWRGKKRLFDVTIMAHIVSTGSQYFWWNTGNLIMLMMEKVSKHPNWPPSGAIIERGGKKDLDGLMHLILWWSVLHPPLSYKWFG